ncbi:hybrid sensor histidine kinase/response regulator [Merismopedia glauca]|uniref:histidine kinase n=1 Tax=Merismopedia glauca CCAP 1448/3 TaxID=1296344 RepID=A0A2T1CAF8_9CYAN|nr:hybrid sensor histidine kinase/response regulator [Merismopedia glauca]PSB05148.1 hybrid sensor histidine kinase/response regulator [Merismopedia glauca CCAP 1448/3]
MKIDTDIRDQAYVFFIQEAPELLQLIESELLTLSAERTPAKVHNMMRAAHSIKGGAASVGLETLKTIAHSLEDVFKALFNEELQIDNQLESLLLQAYDCLRLPLMEQISTGQFNVEQAMAAAEPVFSQLEEILGDLIGSNQLPTSVELGVDIAASIFEIDVYQGIERLKEVLAHPEHNLVAGELRAQSEVFIGISELLSLPGFTEIAQTAIAALDAHPNQAIAITQVAVANFETARQAVLDGDREQGGSVAPELRQLAEPDAFPPQKVPEGFLDLESEPSAFDFGDIFTPLESIENLESIDELNLEGVFDFIEPEADLILPPDEITELEMGNRHEMPANSPSLDDIFGDWNTSSTVAATTEVPELESSPSYLSVTAPQIYHATPVDISTVIKSVETSFEEFPTLQETSAIAQTPVEIIPQSQTQLVNQEIKLETSTVAQPAPASLFVKVDLDRVERLNNLVGELAINRNSLSLQNEQLQATLRELNRRFSKFRQMTSRLRDLSDQMIVSPERHHSGQPPSGLSNHPQNSSIDSNAPSWLGNFDSLEMDSYGELHNLLQDTLEEMVQLEEVVGDVTLISGQSSETLEGQRRMVSNLREDLMWARMMPIGEVLNRFPRLMRDLSNSYQKPVDLKLLGTGVLVDKAAIEKLNYPLMHLLRNAFDHGIEQAEVRRQQNKPERGQVEIRAYHRGSNTIIEIRDDGKGIDFERLRAKAIELEWITAEQASLVSSSQLLEFLFQPGFSTASQVSELSGRGVGLDVVRSELRSVKGTVSVTSELGKGTTFTLKVPLTLNIAKLLVCSVGTTIYAIPSDSIEEIIIPQPQQIKRSGHQRFLHWRNQIVPAYHTSDLISYSCRLPESLPHQSIMGSVPTPEEWAPPMLLIRVDRHLIAIEVDRLVLEQELVIKPLGSAIAPPGYIYGCSIMGDGSLVPVIDVSNLVLQVLDRGQANPIAIRATPQPSISTPTLSEASPQNNSNLVLVVDDSITLRQTLALTLQKANYRVLQARDGREALEQLQKNAQIRLVICDIEMPNMNGFEFLSQRRQDPNISKIPVVMLTSRSSDKHKKLAMHLGAKDYFTKPYIEQEFLGVIQKLITETSTLSLA